MKDCIEDALINNVKHSYGPVNAGSLISNVQSELHLKDDLEVRKTLWQLTADGVLSFTSGFKAVTMNN